MKRVLIGLLTIAFATQGFAAQFSPEKLQEATNLQEFMFSCANYFSLASTCMGITEQDGKTKIDVDHAIASFNGVGVVIGTSVLGMKKGNDGAQ